MTSKRLKWPVDLLIILLGSGIFALSVNLFLAPHNIVTGGLTGVAMLVHHYFPNVGIGLLVILMNLPLFLLSLKMLGRKFLLFSGVGTLFSSILIDLTAPFVKPVETSPLMAALAGGLMMGIGLGVVFLRGATTGGSDLIARLLKVFFPHVRMGIMMLIVDGFIVAASVFVYGHIDPGLQAILAIFISTRAIDLLLYGMDVERVAYIISDNSGRIAEEIDRQLQRGATFLHGEGAYSHKERRIILCAIKRQQISQLKGLVKAIDPHAFLILTEAHEVLGEGFKDYGGHEW